MKLDIRYPIGLLFLVIGAILTVLGLVSPPVTDIGHPESININLWWGLLQIAFGAVMAGLARAAARKAAKP
jgi:hypothetical protein